MTLAADLKRLVILFGPIRILHFQQYCWRACSVYLNLHLILSTCNSLLPLALYRSGLYRRWGQRRLWSCARGDNRLLMDGAEEEATDLLSRQSGASQ